MFCVSVYWFLTTNSCWFCVSALFYKSWNPSIFMESKWWFYERNEQKVFINLYQTDQVEYVWKFDPLSYSLIDLFLIKILSTQLESTWIFQSWLKGREFSAWSVLIEKKACYTFTVLLFVYCRNTCIDAYYWMKPYCSSLGGKLQTWSMGSQARRSISWWSYRNPRAVPHSSQARGAHLS